MRSPCIVLIEDNPSARKMARITLQSEGYQVVEAEDGESALRLVAEHQPDLVLQDLHLPDLDGLDLLKRLRALPEAANTRFLALSGSAERLEEAARMESGFDGTLLKPVEPSRMLETIRTYLGGQRVRGAEKRVLIVDDNKMQLKLTKIQLELSNFKVATATDAQTALEMAREDPPDLIFSDVLMPGMDGFRFCQAIRKDPLLSQVPVLLHSSAYTERADQELAARMGASSLITRTTDLMELTASVLKYASTRPPQEPIPADPGDRYLQRILRQLERQSESVEQLARRTELLESRCAVCTNLGARTNRYLTVEASLRDLMDTCLSAAEISMGAIFLQQEDGTPDLSAHLGFPGKALQMLPQFFGYPEILQKATKINGSTVLQSGQRDAYPGLLEQAGVTAIIVIGMKLLGESSGALVLAVTEGSFSPDQVSYLETLASQISQILGLALSTRRLSESQWALSHVMDRAGCMVWQANVTRSEGNPAVYDWKLEIPVESAAQRLLPLDILPGETYANAWRRSKLSKDLPTMNERSREALESGCDGYSQEYRCRQRDGSIQWLSEDVTIESTGDNRWRLVGVCLNVTQRKQTEEALQQYRDELEMRVVDRTTELVRANEEMMEARDCAKAANRSKSEFLSRMSHELRTPLNAILGFGQLLEMVDLPSRQAESVQRILGAGRHLLNLINEVLDISRIEVGQMHISVEPVCLNDVLPQALEMVRSMASANDITLETLSGERERHVLADKQRLNQVVLNLLSNAVKYNRKGGSVKVSIEDGLPGSIRVSIRDTGYGIPVELRDRLFTPFDRLGAEQGAIEGTGIGLALSKNLVELMGGTIGVQTQPEHGSTFWIELPGAQSPVRVLKQTAPAPEAKSSGGLHGRVLYIEDNLSNFRLVEMLLASHSGIELLSAMQGRLGEDFAREHHPDLIFLDLHLPDIDGDIVLQHLKADPHTASIPVVIISADATSGQSERLRSLGARDYLTKPIDIKRFRDVLSELLTAPANSHELAVSKQMGPAFKPISLIQAAPA